MFFPVGGERRATKSIFSAMSKDNRLCIPGHFPLSDTPAAQPAPDSAVTHRCGQALGWAGLCAGKSSCKVPSCLVQ